MILQKYKNFKNKYVITQRREQEYIVNKYYAHILDPVFTMVVFQLKLTPNSVTILNGIVGVFSGISFFFGHLILGGILLQLHHLLDGADGNLARLTDKCTPLGAKLDKLNDQIVRWVLFLSLSYSSEIVLWAKFALPITMLLDLWIIHQFVLPFSRRNKLKRARWKKWFLDRGIIPGFDIFTVYFVISLFSFFSRIDLAIYLIIIMKNLDWLYRTYECAKTAKTQNTME